MTYQRLEEPDLRWRMADWLTASESTSYHRIAVCSRDEVCWLVAAAVIARPAA